MKKTLITLVFSIALLSCEEAETPLIVETEQFNIQVGTNVLESSDSGWLMLNDLDGNPVDFKAFSNGSKVAFEVEKNANYHLTIIKKTGDFTRYNLETIAGIATDRGFVIGLQYPSMNRPFEPNGEFEVNVLHQQELRTTIISSSLGHLSGLAKYVGNTSSAKNKFQANVPNYLATTRSNIDEIRYSFISDPQHGQQISLNFSQMKSFDKVIKIPASQIQSLTYAVRVLENINGEWKYSYWLNSNIHDNQTAGDSYQIGYLNQFDKYETAMTAILPNKVSAGFTKIGKASESIDLPLHNKISMVSKKINLTEFNSDMPFNNWIGTWRYKEPSFNYVNITWQVWGKESGFKLKGFQSEFTENHPLFVNLELMELSSLQVIRSSRDFEHLVKTRFIERENIEDIQHYSLSQGF